MATAIPSERQLVIITGRSGVGKTSALHALEDAGVYCIDNIPIPLLLPLVDLFTNEAQHPIIAVCIDIRTLNLNKFEELPKMLASLRNTKHFDTRIIFLDADDKTLTRRFSTTRRRHPLGDGKLVLLEALAREEKLLEPLAMQANVTMNTSALSPHELNKKVVKYVLGGRQPPTILFQSFSYRNGIPEDADFVFDVRCLPNPYWIDKFRLLTGVDVEVKDFLHNQAQYTAMLTSLCTALDSWLTYFNSFDRGYINIAVGCTGGRHRSVAMIESLQKHFLPQYPELQVRHRELN